jgi:hypothetical protein
MFDGFGFEFCYILLDVNINFIANNQFDVFVSEYEAYQIASDQRF